MDDRSFFSIYDRVLFGHAAAVVHARREWAALRAKNAQATPPPDLATDCQMSMDMLRQAVYDKLQLKPGDEVPFESKMLVCGSIRIYLRLNEELMDFDIHVFPDGEKHYTSSRGKPGSFLFEDAAILTIPHEAKAVSGKILLSVGNDRFMCGMWETLKEGAGILDSPIDLYRSLGYNGTYRWLSRCGAAEEVQKYHRDLYDLLERKQGQTATHSTGGTS